MSREEERTRLEEIKTGKDHHWKNLFLLIIIVVVCDRRKQLNATASERRIRAEETVKPCSNVFFLFFLSKTFTPLSFRQKMLVLTDSASLHIFTEVTDG